MKHITLLKSQLHKRGGIEKNVWKIAKGFTEKGYIVKILTSSTKPIFHPLFHIDTCKEKKYFPSFYKIFKFNRFCKNRTNMSNNEIIFGMDRNQHQTHIRAGNGVHKAYLAKRRKTSSFLKRALFFINPLHRIILSYEKKGFENKNLKTLFVNSNLVKNEILQFYNVDPKKIFVIHNGVEWKEFEKPFDQSFLHKPKILKELNLPLNGIYFLFVGNGYARKGLLELLHAFASFNQNNIYLLVVGKDKRINFYKRKAQKLKIDKKVFFFGATNNTIPFYQVSEVFILPTHYDPFSNVVLEALSMGLHVITSSDNGAHEILTAQNGQILHNSHDINEISRCLHHSLNYKKTKTSAMKIRNSVKNHDYSNQLKTLINYVIDV